MEKQGDPVNLYCQYDDKVYEALSCGPEGHKGNVCKRLCHLYGSEPTCAAIGYPRQLCRDAAIYWRQVNG